MINPFATLIEKTAPTPVKDKGAYDENVDGNAPNDLGSDIDVIDSPLPKDRDLEHETPGNGRKKSTRSASFRHDILSPIPKSAGRVRNSSNREMGPATPSMATPMKVGSLGVHIFDKSTPISARSAPKLPRPGAIGTPGRNRSNSNREVDTPCTKPKPNVPRVNIMKPKPAVKMLDKALRESLGGFDMPTVKNTCEMEELASAAKKQRENAINLRRRPSNASLDDSETEIENTVRRQSAVLLNEFKELVKSAADAAEAEGGAGDGEDVAKQDSGASDDIDSDRRESMALDQALVRQILPRKVCIPLREGKKVPPEAFQGVSIFFSDVVGFTTISSEVEPILVHELLNNLFTVMDYCTALFPLYKVETIGDAYMVAGGLPEPNEHNARDLADFALVVSAAVSACVRSPIDGSPIQIRIGCHTGDVMAGVVGTLMPRYCLFGDTVNTASRMESNGAPGEIHCSEAFVNKLSETGLHIVKERGEIEVKGKGVMRTYWLEGASSSNPVASSPCIAEIVTCCKELLPE